MRTYRYRCTQCKNEFEVQRSIQDESPQECEECGSTETQRLILAVAVTYKGNGFTKKVEEK